MSHGIGIQNTLQLLLCAPYKLEDVNERFMSSDAD